MPRTKDGGFLMDDGDMMPYSVPTKKDIKSSKPKTTKKKNKDGNKK